MRNKPLPLVARTRPLRIALLQNARCDEGLARFGHASRPMCSEAGGRRGFDVHNIVVEEQHNVDCHRFNVRDARRATCPLSELPQCQPMLVRQREEHSGLCAVE